MSAPIRTLIAVVILTSIPIWAGAAEPVVVLATLGGADARANDINDGGQIAGWSELSGGAVEATVWSSGVPTGLGLAPGTGFSFANAINNVGEVAGYSETGTVPGQSGNPRTATFWGAAGVVDIGAAMAFTSSTAYDLNDGGVVALQGNHPESFGFTTGYVWSLAMGGTQAGPDPFYRFGANHGINNLNDIVGIAAAGFDGQQAILARFNGKGWDVGVEIGPQAVRAPATANAISDSGIVVGQAGDGGVHVFEAALFTLDPGKPVVWLDKLDDFDDSTALDVNSAGLVVGDALRFGEAGVEQRAVVWIDEQIYDLNHLLRPNSSFKLLVSATGVNADGDVVGYGKLANGDERPFLIPRLGQGPSSKLLGHPGEPAPLP